MTSFYGGGAVSTSGGESVPIKGALIFKGTLGISNDGATVLVLPDEHEEGWTYLVVTAGTYAGQLCEKGDFIICVSSGEAASDLDWTVVQGNTFNTLPTPTALDEGKIISVDTSGNYVLIDNPSSGETENLPDPSEADEGKIISVGVDGNYILTDNPAKDKLDKNNGTATGTTTFDKAQADSLELLVNGKSIGGFRPIDSTPAVTDKEGEFVPLSIGEPTKDSHAASKQYVDNKLEEEKQARESADSNNSEQINTLREQITQLPYLSNNGDTATGAYDFTGATINVSQPNSDNNVANKKYVDTKVATIQGSGGSGVSYTQGNGITISPENTISINLNQNKANGLKIDSDGLSLENASSTQSGAMSATDKQNLDTAIQDINNIKTGSADLPYIKDENGSFSGTLTGENTIFTGSVQIREPIEDNEATNKSYVDDQIKNIKLSYYTPNVDEQGNLTWIGNNEGMLPIDSSNIMGPQGPKGPQGPPGEIPDPLAGKKILIAGDSVAFGYGWEGGFKNLIEEDFRGAEVKNVAVSGAKLTQNQIQREITNAIYTQGFQPDIVIFDGGWNDLMEGVETGTVDFDTYAGTQNSNSNNVLGALEYLFFQFQNLFPEIQLVYFSIYKIVPFTGDSKTMPSYSEQRSFNESIKSVCQKYGVAFVDFWNCGAVTPSVSNNAHAFFYDFMHVNEAGYRMLWPVLKEKLFSLGKNVLIPNGDEMSY